MRWITLDPEDPLSIANGIALFNFATIAFTLVVSTGSGILFNLGVLSALSFPLMIYSRKIWAPCLISGWILLGIVLAHLGLQSRTRVARFCLWVSPICFVFAGHMYLSAFFVFPIVAIVIGLHLKKNRDHKALGAWTGGCLLGLLSFAPYVSLMMFQRSVVMPGSPGHMPYTAPKILELVAFWFSSAFPWELANNYFSKAVPYIVIPHKQMMTGLAWMAAICTTLPGLLVFVGALRHFVFNVWNYRSSPLAKCSFCVLVSLPIALQAMRLGNSVHYWIAAMPFCYFLMAEFISDLPKSAQVEKWSYRSYISFAVLACVGFLISIKINHGLPGEYGPSYQIMSHASQRDLFWVKSFPQTSFLKK